MAGPVRTGCTPPDEEERIAIELAIKVLSGEASGRKARKWKFANRDAAVWRMTARKVEPRAVTR